MVQIDECHLPAVARLVLNAVTRSGRGVQLNAPTNAVGFRGSLESSTRATCHCEVSEGDSPLARAAATKQSE